MLTTRRFVGAASLAIAAAACGQDQSASREGVQLQNVSAAMEPTIRAGESVEVAPFGTPDSVGGLERGALVMHAFPAEPTKRYIKRLSGLPGDTLAMKRGVLHVNGNPLDEPYAHAGQADSSLGAQRNNWGPLVVPADSFFVLGDNRDHSADSRYWGFVPRHLILGRVVKPRAPAP